MNAGWRRWWWAIRVRRRMLAAVAAGMAVWLGLESLAPPPPPSTSAVVVQTQVPAGSALRSEDLAVVEVPDRWLPEDALTSIDDVEGHSAITALAANTILTETALTGRGSTPAGTAVAPVQINDAQLLEVLRVGDVVSIVATDSAGEIITLAQRVPVVGLPDGSILLVRTDPETAATLSVWSQQQSVGITLG